MNTFTRCVLAQCHFSVGRPGECGAIPALPSPIVAPSMPNSRPSTSPAWNVWLRAVGGARQEVTAAQSRGRAASRPNNTQETVEQVTVKIENATYGHDGKGLFRMADGQVWKAQKARPARNSSHRARATRLASSAENSAATECMSRARLE